MNYSKASLVFVLCFTIVGLGSLLFACGNQVTVKFNTRGGNDIDKVYITRDYSFSSDGKTLPVPTRTGYSFEGWFIDKDCTLGNEFNANNRVNGDMTIYARWAVNARYAPSQAAVTYKDRYGDGEDVTVYVPIGSTLELPAGINNADQSKTLIGWYFDEDCTDFCGTDLPINGDITLYSNWKKLNNNQPETPTSDSKIHVMFDLQYVHPVMGQRWSCDFGKQIPLYYISRPSSRPGYTFVGWSFVGGLTPDTTPDTGNTKIYYNGFNRDTEIMKAPENASVDPRAYDYLIEDNVTYYANWTEDNSSPATWKINYHLMYDNLVETAEVAKANESTESYYRVRLYNYYVPVRPGYTFEGWYKNSSLTNKFTIPQYGLILTEDLNLYAKWNEGGEGGRSVVKCYSPKAEGSNEFVLISEYTILVGSKLDLPAATMDGRAFVDWYKDKQYTNRFIIDDNYIIQEDLTLYAKWVWYAVGDVNKSGTVTVDDYDALKDLIIAKHNFTREELAICDTNRNGRIDRFDLHAIMAFCMVNSSINQTGGDKLDGIMKLPATMFILENFDFDGNGVVETGAPTDTKDTEIYNLQKKDTGYYDYNQDRIVTDSHSTDDSILQLVMANDSGPQGLYQTFKNAGVPC